MQRHLVEECVDENHDRRQCICPGPRAVSRTPPQAAPFSLGKGTGNQSPADASANPSAFFRWLVSETPIVISAVWRALPPC
jgi:hypothetical protein